MTIRTRYELEDWVWFMRENAIHRGVIKRILVNIEEGQIIDKYSVQDTNDGTRILFEFEYLFPSKEELLKSLYYGNQD